ncbi:hypothetical protein NQ318_018829 [Aromia moschata]|uniref:GCN5-related N-acetyltransferase Rv2170-like domain-containing protein n=1 Tax=Aromia moschata TaxID=1265417 RepID=A0AAV8ZIE4_9CUCU|nr:hypothetical protein NQ318_018829 [Aromia moschata]
MLAKKIAEEDEDPTATISVSNVNSQTMFKKVGLHQQGPVDTHKQIIIHDTVLLEAFTELEKK